MMKKLYLSIIIFFFLSFNVKAQSTIKEIDSFDVSIDSKAPIDSVFSGGFVGWKNYLVRNLIAETPSKNKAKRGAYKVIVQFILSKDGTISDVMPLTSHGYGMEAEVVKVIKKGPSWKPRSWNAPILSGKISMAYIKQSITFVVK